LAGPLNRILEALPPQQQAAIKEPVRVALSAYLTPDGLTVPGLSYVASARRPAPPT